MIRISLAVLTLVIKVSILLKLIDTDHIIDVGGSRNYFTSLVLLPILKLPCTINTVYIPMVKG